MNDYFDELPSGFDLMRTMIDDPDHFRKRDALRKRYAFAIPTDAALKTILDLGNEIVEIGAGSGYWAHLLDERGATVYAYDDGSWSDFWSEKPWHEIREGGPARVTDHDASAIVLLIWPPYGGPMAWITATKLKVNQHLVYIGEDQGGCNGDDDFFELLESDYEQIGHAWIPQWYGLHDRLQIFRRTR